MSYQNDKSLHEMFYKFLSHQNDKSLHEQQVSLSSLYQVMMTHLKPVLTTSSLI